MTEYPRNFIDHGASYMPIIPLPDKIVKIAFLAASLIFVILSVCGLYLARKDGNERTSSLWCRLFLPACSSSAPPTCVTAFRWCLPC